MKNKDYSHLTHIESLDELRLYELIPNVVWIFDLDKHGWWWGNQAAIDFWGLDTLDDLINKDLSDDTQGARDRTVQTFDLAVKNGLTIDPWTTYPNGKPKTLFMMHRAVTLGPDRHRGIIAYINEEVNLGEAPENLLLVEAMRYTNVLVTSFTLDGKAVIENPSTTAAYKHVHAEDLPDGVESEFIARFYNPADGRQCLRDAIDQKGGRWTYQMNTLEGKRLHTLDIRMSRHPLSGDSLILVVEYDVTELHDAQEELRRLAHYDALTGLPSLRFLQSNAAKMLAHADRNNEKLALLFIDLDGFKGVNDSCGHEGGDLLLKELSRRFTGILRNADDIARIGGDEFVILITDVNRNNDASVVAQKIIDEACRPFHVAGQSVQIGASVGVAFYPEDGRDIPALLKAADKAMYRVKNTGKRDFCLAANAIVN
ncbi:hypothetical protein GCM10011332_14070 [Terasakiella brassicae]|uniref:GGDEF domain-containing protein n=1 Tax=Terasakiella brassicae TaxID=1634917 RepID=A0A917BYM9_9PROT|nr:GGDEF domain-containing protein [Terasakiella brassicae]GGF61480.1 hypothetical protein GCM10011332_14070 [Terasakiella brassicae]